ncbi:MAG TPA: M23 family metallopeptidase [Chitinophagaceae bacterium]|jgi:murein DD-endopeptidase MepM/ murein hydrolase activator NlpD|nr:M23 family metallopeptidase [Chitinophagaceae bacterium]
MKNRALFLLFLALSAVSFSFTHPPVRKPSKGGSKALVYPVAGTRSQIRDKWGASRAGGIRKHKGIDIHARKGTPVVAISDGVIVSRDRTPIGGKTLWLKSTRQGWTAYYAHLDKQFVREGQAVRKGQVIGTVGNTGNARTTPPHLHFGVKKGNSWVNPLPYVKGATKVPAPKMTVTKKSAPAKKKSAARKGKR